VKNKLLISLLRYAALTGNVIFSLWITYNGLKAGFSGTIYEKLSYVGLMVLLTLNSFLILGRMKKE
jgi:hypothetical protein